MNPIGLAVVTAAAVALSAAGAGAHGPPAAADDALLRAAVEGYLANGESFPQMTCRYTVTAAHAKTLADAVAGRNYSQVQVAKRLLVVDGKKVRHLQEADPESLNTLRTGKPKPEPGSKTLASITVTFSSSDYLAKNGDELLFNPVHNYGNLFTPVLPCQGGDQSPLSLAGFGRGSQNIAYWLRESDAGRAPRRVEGMRDVDGVPALCVSFELAKGRGRVDYALDPQRGFLPLRQTNYSDGKHHSHKFITQIRACSGGRWFPERVVIVFEPDRPGGPYDLRESKVIELDVEHRPKAEDFVVTLPAGAAIINVAEKRPTFRLKQQETITPDDLPRLLVGHRG